jgi:hypothetical protein
MEGAYQRRTMAMRVRPTDPVARRGVLTALTLRVFYTAAAAAIRRQARRLLFAQPFSLPHYRE